MHSLTRIRWFFAVLAFVVPVLLRADDSAMNEGAYGPEPREATAGAESIIRMESERITVKFGRTTSEVKARFVFRSYKPKEPARQLVGFPDTGAAYEEAARRDPKGEATTWLVQSAICTRSWTARKSNPKWNMASC